MLAFATCLVLGGCGTTVAREASDPSGARIIELEAHPSLQFLQAGEPVHDIPVVPGETVVFRIDNTAGFAQNFYIGLDEELGSPPGTTATGIPAWSTWVKEFTWVALDDIGTAAEHNC